MKKEQRHGFDDEHNEANDDGYDDHEHNDDEQDDVEDHDDDEHDDDNLSITSSLQPGVMAHLKRI